MKAINIEWDKEDTSVDLPSEIEIPEDFMSEVRAEHHTESYIALYENTVEAIGEYITNETGFCHMGFEIETSRKDAIQYCLDQGTGIEYEPELGVTTEKERGREGTTRYVEPHTVDFFAHQTKELRFCLIAHMDLIDFDEWMAVREAFAVDMPYEDAAKIIDLLYEKYDYSTLEMGETPKATVRDTVGTDISPEDEKAIYDIVSGYGSPAKLSESEKTVKRPQIEKD